MIPCGLFPDEIAMRTYIAGGWAACPALAGDMDLWVLCPEGRLEQERLKLLGILQTHEGVEAVEDVQRETGHDYDGIVHQIRKVAKIEYNGTKIHLMVTDAPDVFALLDGFDITTHCVAIDPFGMVIRGRYFSAVNQPVHSVDGNSNEKSQSRWERIRDRFAPFIS
jgi:hypothetical protein